jgi:MoaA/NifB/PqqE/SkfB family radical SAM enzyme
MKRCLRVGIDVTKRCNWRCKTCFYRHKDWFNTPEDKSLFDAMREVTEAKRRGCDHAVLVGWGETALWPHTIDFIKECKTIDIKTSIITNGTIGIKTYYDMYLAGLNHLHVSVHGMGDTLNRIAEKEWAAKRQAQTLDWLESNKLPWRSNTTLQKENAGQLCETIDYIIRKGAYHIVLLGFLPHYEWGNRLKEVAVRSMDLRPNLEYCLRAIVSAGRYATLRYHPMCHLDPYLRKYVVNARYVLYDPNEWDYGHSGDEDAKLWNAAVNEIGGAVAIKGKPCCNCTHFVHCGGFNQTYTNGFDGNDLCAIATEIEQTPGFLHDQNPVNATAGHV